jgi:hypothetical protein
MTETQAVYQVNDISPELLKAIREVLSAGYGEVVVKIADGKIDVVEKKVSVKVK